jgi:uncharacterized small protein (DUF1192 family)
MVEDDAPRPKRQIIVGDDLYAFSVTELEERIDRLRREIERTEAELKKKSSERAAADAFFSR